MKKPRSSAERSETTLPSGNARRGASLRAINPYLSATFESLVIRRGRLVGAFLLSFSVRCPGFENPSIPCSGSSTFKKTAELSAFFFRLHFGRTLARLNLNAAHNHLQCQFIQPSRQGHSALDYQCPVFGIDAQGSAAGKASPFCSSSMEMLSGDRINAIWPSRGGRLMVTPIDCKCSQIA